MQSKKEILSGIEGLEGIKNNFLFFLENTTDYVYFKDKHHHFTYTSNAFAQLTGHANWQALIGKDDFDIFPAEHAAVYFEKEKAVINEGKALHSIEEPYYNTEGKLCWVSSSKKPIVDNDGNIIGLFGISRDITKIKELETKLAERAHFDHLTKLPNRAYFLDQAQNALDLAKRNKQSLAFLYIDLDGFKHINDQHGHQAGDTVLTTIANRFNQALRSSDIIGRLGGDEFAVASLTNDKDANLIRLSAALTTCVQEPITYKSHQLNIKCSIGLACFPKNGDAIHDLMDKADKAMYTAKENNHLD